MSHEIGGTGPRNCENELGSLVLFTIEGMCREMKLFRFIGYDLSASVGINFVEL